MYNTETSSYVKIEDITELLKHGHDIKVVDAKTAEDLTRTTLIQIILEEESKGEELLPDKFMKKIIHFYTNSEEKNILPLYLNSTIDTFANNYKKMQEATEKALGSNPFTNITTWQEKNIELMKTAFSVFNPFMQEKK